jgi:acyl-CoA synthetase (NDP forming)
MRHEQLLAPRSVAVIGASDTPGNRGGTAVSYLRKFGFNGAIWPVHPQAESVGGIRAYPSVAALPEPADVAVIGLAAARVLPALRECVAAGIHHAIVWAGGFAEGGPEGRALEDGLVEFCSSNEMTFIGPNCIGVVSTAVGFTGTFASWLTRAEELLPGKIAIVTQSGGLGATAHNLAQAAGLGLSYVVSTGNEAMLGVNDMVEAFAEDPELKVVSMYLEGMRDGAGYLAAVRRARRSGKDVVVLRGGRSPSSARAAAAHTGALVGASRVWDNVLAREGAVPVRSIEELVHVSGLLTQLRNRGGGARLGIVCFGGGMGVLCADQAHDAGLVVPTLSESLRKTLAPFVPAIASLGTPLDLTPEMFTRDEWRANFRTVLDLLDHSGEVDQLICLCGAMQRGGEDITSSLAEFARAGEHDVIVSWPFAPPADAAKLRAAGVYVFGAHAEAVATLGTIVTATTAEPPPDDLAVPAGAGDWTVPLAGVTEEQILLEPAAHDLLREIGLATLPGRVAASAEEASRIAREIDGPVALKAVSPAVLHRAAAGLVRLGVEGDDEVRAAFTEIHSRLGPGDAVYVQAMAPPGGRELFLSASADPTFGVVIAVGAGGVRVEALDRVRLLRAPIGRAEAERVIGALGVLDDDHAAIAHAADYVTRFSQAMAGAPWPDFAFEINPVIVSGERAIAADGLVILNSGKETGDD